MMQEVVVESLLDLVALCARKYPVPHRITEEGKVIGLVSRGKEIRIIVTVMNHAGHTGRVKTKLLYFNAWYELVCIIVAAPDKSDHWHTWRSKQYHINGVCCGH